MNLIFEPDKHAYFLDGKELPSVTQVIKGAGLMPVYTDMKACEYGTLVHKAVCAICHGEEYPVDPFVEIAVQGFREWQKLYRPETNYSEMPLANLPRGYAGTVDLVCKISGKYWLIDVKTGAYSPWHIIQLAAYGELCKGQKIRIDKFACLYLDPVEAGKFIFKEISKAEIQAGFSVFLNCLNVYKFKKNHNYETGNTDKLILKKGNHGI